MAGGNQARCDAWLQVADCRPDARLHRFASKMVAAENEIDRLIWELRFCFKAGIDNPGVRARGKDGYAPAGDADGDEPFIHDQ